MNNTLRRKIEKLEERAGVGVETCIIFCESSAGRITLMRDGPDAPSLTPKEVDRLSEGKDQVFWIMYVDADHSLTVECDQ